MKQVTISKQVFSDSIGSEWNDIDTAGAAYAEYLEDVLAKELEASGYDADVTVSYHSNLAGHAATRISGDDEGVEDIINAASDRAWNAFCGNPENASL